MTMGDPPNVQGAVSCGSMSAVMGLLQSGRVEFGAHRRGRGGHLRQPEHHPGGVRRPGHPPARIRGRRGHRLPGRTAADPLAPRKAALQAQDQLPHLPGTRPGPDWRREKGLVGGGPRAIITNLCIFDFDPETLKGQSQEPSPGGEAGPGKGEHRGSRSSPARTRPPPRPQPRRNWPWCVNTTRKGSGPVDFLLDKGRGPCLKL